MLDNVYEISGFPLAQQAKTARASRRLGLGITGLADALIMLGLRYDSPEARSVAADAMRTVAEQAYSASVELAAEKGAFPLCDRERYLAAPFVHALPAALQADIARHGIRNSHLTAIAPAGTISLLAGNVSRGRLFTRRRTNARSAARRPDAGVVGGLPCASARPAARSEPFQCIHRARRDARSAAEMQAPAGARTTRSLRQSTFRRTSVLQFAAIFGERALAAARSIGPTR
jgi:hypothetical protein